MPRSHTSESDVMKTQSIVISQLALSLVFAMGILIADRLLAGSPSNEAVKYVLVAIWFVPFSLLSGLGMANRKHSHSV